MQSFISPLNGCQLLPTVALALLQAARAFPRFKDTDEDAKTVLDLQWQAPQADASPDPS